MLQIVRSIWKGLTEYLFSFLLIWNPLYFSYSLRLLVANTKGNWSNIIRAKTYELIWRLKPIMTRFDLSFKPTLNDELKNPNSFFSFFLLKCRIITLTRACNYVTSPVWFDRMYWYENYSTLNMIKEYKSGKHVGLKHLRNYYWSKFNLSPLKNDGKSH